MKLTDADYLHLDITAGISGNLFIAAALDAFPQLQPELEQVLALLCSASSTQLKLNKVVEHGVCCSQLELNFSPKSKQTNYFVSLKTSIQALNIQDEIAQIAINLLTILATAKSKIQAIKTNQVTFDELPELNLLFELLGSAIVIYRINPSVWSISDLPINQGVIQTPNGPSLQPSPLIAELLKGFLCVPSNHNVPCTTAIGAALLRYLKTQQPVDTANNKIQLAQTGYSVCYPNHNSLTENKDNTNSPTSKPALLRLMCYQKQPIKKEQNLTNQAVILLSFDIDDMTAEELGWAIDKLRADSKVIDITVNSVRGKKNRLVEQVQIVLAPLNLQSVTEDCFRLTSTIGLRWHYAERFCLSREQKILNQNGATIGVKLVTRPAQHNEFEQTIKVESDDLAHCQSLSERRKLKQQLE
ncbi:nickel insertion protein [Catenovulum adriaticum]|uniref:LarC family nickel insertion protein n=1 Tax=Catenovulum adriaticum TaxID=2984846 RepID=A0ABY7ASB5_9ALTE|nr:nickel insertion protein [Catenovulum sp. TS8]WAJ72369.1 LarC family nickel insertion protein [Catenovulum sp. TS8]